MNIVNIFGLHIGCEAVCKRYDGAGKLVKVDENTCMIAYDNGDITAEYSKDCKLLLKPLSAITDEDKAELAHLVGGYAKAIIFLASKGYDIGIIPEEYREVEQ
jgi:hypothetical protein